MKIIHIIVSLKRAGAEKNLFNLVTSDKKNHHIVISLTNLDYYGKILRQKKFKIYSLNFNQNLNDCRKMFTLYRIIKNEKPDIVQTWMYYADIIGGIVAKLAGIKKIFWNLRSDGLDLKRENLKIIPFYLVFPILSILIPRKIIVNSKRGISKHVFFLNKNKFSLIHNGFKIPKIKKTTRTKKFVIGHLGRFHPLKNHEMILKFAERLNDQKVNFLLILGGKGVNNRNAFFTNRLKDKVYKNRIVLKNEVTNINNFYQKLDCLINTSISEGFPNVLAEAMANKVICLTTDVGEAKYIVDNSSRIFNNYNDLINKVKKLKKLKDTDLMNWLKIKNNCKKRIEKKFTIKKMVSNYNKVWELSAKN